MALSSVFVNRAGEWKLSGLEFSHSNELTTSPDQIIHKSRILPSLDKYEPPEKQNSSSGQSSLSIEPYSTDSYGLACLIWEAFNGFLTSGNSLKSIGKIPKRLTGVFNDLMSSNPRSRLSSLKFIEKCCQKSGFMDNHFVNTLLFLEKIQIKEQSEKTKFFTELTEKLDDFPKNLCQYKILPQLINAHDFMNAGSSILAPLLKLGKMLDEVEYQKKIIPIVVKLFTSTDRTTRMRLLQTLNLFIEHLSPSVINDQIFQPLCLGFSDSNPAIREATIRAIVLLAPKLNHNNLNIELMKYFAKLQASDDQGMIRTNTTICIGKIAAFISPQLRQRILLSAFPKAMRDPFPAARLSGIIALANTDLFYTLKDISTKILPSLCIACVDPDKEVRDEAFKIVKMFLDKLEKVSEKPELALEMEKDVNSCNLDVKNETSWTSWAMNSLSAKVSNYTNKKQQPSIALSTTTQDLKKNLEEKTSPTKTVEEQVKKPQIENDKETKVNDGWETNDLYEDFEDDEPMQSLEPIEAKPNLSTKIENKTSTKVAGWDDWSDFDVSQSKPSNDNNNWEANGNVNSDDFFSNLVKDTKKVSLSKPLTPQKANDWNFDNFEPIESKNSTSMDTKKRQSKPLKLGAKSN